MYEKQIVSRDEGQRLDKYLGKLLPNAGTSFLYKMLRKKNITLNDKKASGTEKLVSGDVIKIFFSEETLQKFMGNGGDIKETSSNKPSKKKAQETSYRSYSVEIVYEDEDYLFIDKPANMLSQKAKENDYSINEWIIDYLIDTKQLTQEDMRSFRPTICNRLDRNTTGLILCAKSLKGAQKLSALLKERSAHKYYYAVVEGLVEEGLHMRGYLVKNSKTNKVQITTQDVPGSDFIETAYKPIYSCKEYTVLEVLLVTGKSHQIRAHLASIGHPIIGDMKYGNATTNQKYYEKYHIKTQLLHAYRVEFPTDSSLGAISGKEICTRLPDGFNHFLIEE